MCINVLTLPPPAEDSFRGLPEDAPSGALRAWVRQVLRQLEAQPKPAKDGNEQSLAPPAATPRQRFIAILREIQRDPAGIKRIMRRAGVANPREMREGPIAPRQLSRWVTAAESMLDSGSFAAA